MIRGKTANGFEFEIDDGVRDDLELAEWLILLERGDMGHLPETLVSLLGVDQKKRLYEFCRGENGRVSSVKVFETLNMITTELDKDEDVKN